MIGIACRKIDVSRDVDYILNAIKHGSVKAAMIFLYGQR